MGVDLPNIDVENDFEGEFAEQVTPEIDDLEGIENRLGLGRSDGRAHALLVEHTKSAASATGHA